MFQQQAYIINNILMALDAIAILISGYFAFFIRFHLAYGNFRIDHTVFVVSILSVVVINTYVMGKLKLYGEKKSASISSLLFSILKAVLIDFILLSSVIYLLQQTHYSRLYLILFAGLCFVFISTYRMGLQFYMRNVSRHGFQICKILIVSDEK